MAEKLSEGDHCFLGSYPQGADGKKTPIEWEIIRCRDGKVTLLSKYILDIAKGIGDPFDWCEDHFRDAAFDKEEQELLCDLIGLPTYMIWPVIFSIISWSSMRATSLKSP